MARATTGSCRTLVLDGLEAVPAQVLVEPTSGPPGLDVELGNESAQRLKGALSACGIAPEVRQRVWIEPRPGDEDRQAALHDLPAAIAVAASVGKLESSRLKPPNADTVSVGMLDSQGRIQAVRGMTVAARWAREHHAHLCAPAAQRGEATAGRPITGWFAWTLDELLKAMRSGPAPTSPPTESRNTAKAETSDYDLGGWANLRRAIAVAVAGRHPLLIEHTTSAPVTALARWATLLEQLDSPTEAAQVADAYSVAGLLSPAAPEIGRRPLRAPHPTVSAAAVAGRWGTTDGERAAARPGELTLANGGVFYLDRVEEWTASALDAVARAWLEGEVRLARGGLPSRFTPIAGTPEPERATRATGPHKPLGKIIQLRVDAGEDQAGNHAGGRWSTSETGKRVARAIERQRRRQTLRNGEFQMSSAAPMTQDWSIDPNARVAALQFKGETERRATTAVARTVADMLDSDTTTERHVEIAATLCGAGNEDW